MMVDQISELRNTINAYNQLKNIKKTIEKLIANEYINKIEKFKWLEYSRIM